MSGPKPFLEEKTSLGKLVIRPLRKDDMYRVLELFKLSFGKEKDEKLWYWEFFQHPYGTMATVAELDGEIVAQCASIPVFFSARGTLLKGAQLVDCMSHPGVRGVAVKKKGIFALTVQAFFDAFTGCDRLVYLYGFPSERHYRLGRLLLGYRKTEPVLEVVAFDPFGMVLAGF